MRALEDYPDADLRIFDRPELPAPDDIDDVYLIGICGTGMGSLAALFQQAGYRVRGSDQAAWPPMSVRLADLGIPIIEGYSAENLEPAPSLVVVGNACTPTHVEAAAARDRGLAQASFPEALAHYFIGDRKSIVIAGTHGKTSTTGLLVHVFESAGLDPGYLVGGVRVGSDQSQAVGSGRYFVSEGDEYDSAYFDKRSKFFHYRPDIAVVTSVEFDHADIFEGDHDYREVFADFAASIDEAGLLTIWGDDPIVRAVGASAGCRVITYGFDSGCDLRADKLRPTPEGTWFSIFLEDGSEHEMLLRGWGRHNVLNALPVVAIALEEGLDLDTIHRGLADYPGMKRRQEIRGIEADVIVVDDFAHHPTAVRETILATRERWPNRRIVAVFEPRSNSSRQKLFENVYPGALGNAHAVFLARPPVRHNDRPEDFMDIDVVAEAVRKLGVPTEIAPSAESLLDPLTEYAASGDVLLLMSNGAMGGLHVKLLDALKNNVTSTAGRP
ncbi:MAG: UDP-N-acetylmuramate--L-alanine ligase [Candidatus Latescibacterota bacterium]|jgi:UDP-N-acetylmuramate: L-alanyl-gamma-D-glutamyl-meso-diaminopimelate ligase